MRKATQGGARPGTTETPERSVKAATVGTVVLYRARYNSSASDATAGRMTTSPQALVACPARGRGCVTERLGPEGFSVPGRTPRVAGAACGAARNRTASQTRRKAPGNYPHASWPAGLTSMPRGAGGEQRPAYRRTPHGVVDSLQPQRYGEGGPSGGFPLCPRLDSRPKGLGGAKRTKFWASPYRRALQTPSSQRIISVSPDAQAML